MKTEFTKGKWRAGKDAQGICGIMHPTLPVAVCCFTSLHVPVNGYVGDDKQEYGRPERQANARLILEAQEMYRIVNEFALMQPEGCGALISRAVECLRRVEIGDEETKTMRDEPCQD